MEKKGQYVKWDGDVEKGRHVAIETPALGGMKMLHLASKAAYYTSDTHCTATWQNRR